MQDNREGVNDSELVAAVIKSYERYPRMSHLEGGRLASRERTWAVVEDLLRLLFPGFLESGESVDDQITRVTGKRMVSVHRCLEAEIERGLRLRDDSGTREESRRLEAHRCARLLLRRLPAIRDVLAGDVEAAYEGDPAARSRAEIIVAYPGLQAIAVYRLAHVLYEAGVPLVPRVMTEYTHARTGIDIHPGARIGRGFFIDHGTGVVIGETTRIGNHVKIYQGVTLGARSFEKDMDGNIIKGIKRHPDIEDSVTIYSGATILGAIRIGAGSVIGGNVWLTHDIPADTRIVVRPPQQIHIDRAAPDYQI